jgi:hypothetical protein
MKEKNIKKKRIGENWMDGEILHLIALWGKIEFKFIINTKNQNNFQFTWNPSCACFGKKKKSNLKLEWSDFLKINK